MVHNFNLPSIGKFLPNEVIWGLPVNDQVTSVASYIAFAFSANMFVSQSQSKRYDEMEVEAIETTAFLEIIRNNKMSAFSISLSEIPNKIELYRRSWMESLVVDPLELLFVSLGVGIQWLLVGFLFVFFTFLLQFFIIIYFLN